VIDGVSEPVDHAHVGVDGVDPLVDVGDLSEAARSDSDDLLQDEVGGVEPDRELVGSERSERLLTADELQRYLAKVDGGRVEDDPSGLPSRSSRSSVNSGWRGSSGSEYSISRSYGPSSASTRPS